jgi:hypothetical protein
MFRFLTAFAFACGLLTAALPAWAGFDEGKAAYNRQDWGLAVLNLRTSGEAGDARALVLLGNMYLDGLGVLKDGAQAFALYRRAALLGNADGMFATAVMYQNGEGITRDIKHAISWFRRAAELGHGNAAFLYAVQLFQGSKGKAFDMKPDLPEAYFWFRRAALAKSSFEKTATVSAEKIKQKISPAEAEKQDERIKNWRPADIKDYPQPPDEEAQ